MSDYMTVVSLLGDSRRYLTGIGSFQGCMSEAASIRKRLRPEKFVAMGPGDWQSDNVLVEVIPRKKIFESACEDWVSADHFRNILKGYRALKKAASK